MKQTSIRTLLAGFILAVVVLGGVAWLNWHTTLRLQDTVSLVSHTEDVRNKLIRLRLQIEEVETGARGFVLTGETSFLEPYKESADKVKGQMKIIRALTRDNPRQQEDCNLLEPLIEQELIFAQAMIATRQDSGLEPARQLVASGEGKALMDQIRGSLTRMDVEERSLLEERSLATGQEATKARLITLVGTTLSFTVLGAVFTLVLRENQLRRQSQLELGARNAELGKLLRANQLIMEHSLDLICTIDEQGRFVFLSAACEKILGYPPTELAGKKYIDLVHADDLAKTNEAALKIMNGEPLQDFENRYRRKDGVLVPIVWTATWSQEDRLMFCVARDMTERKAGEERVLRLNLDLQSRTNELENANKELESFSYSVSHDLRAPLRHIHGYVEMLTEASEGQLSDKAKRYLKVITDASVEMGQLIDDLLAFSRMGRIEFHESAVDLNECVRGTIKGLEMATKGRSINWKIAALPMVQGDSAMLKQVLSNLIGNAVKYSRKREPAEIEIGQAGEEDGRAVFFVRDNGAGFDMKYGHKLFGVFQRDLTPEKWT